MAPSIALPSTANEPTKTLPQVITKILASRQSTTTVITDSGSGTSATTLTGGAIAGIVIGSIAGILLLIWIIRSCSNLGRPGGWGNTFEPAVEKRSSAYITEPAHRHRSHSRHSHHHHSRSPRRVAVVQPVVYGSRGRSPRAPPSAYHGGRASHDGRRRSSDARGYRY